MDVLYYIGSGSNRNNMELRYSLRALDKFGHNIDRVFIVGNKPAFLRNVEYLWVEDKYEWWRNAFEKTKAAIKAGISDEFLLMNDDFFMLEDFDAEKYPFFYRGQLPETSTRQYTDVLLNTRKILKAEGKPTKHFGVHCPMRIKGEQYLTLEKYINEPVSARCLYGNLFVKNARLVEDCKGGGIKKSPTKCYSSKSWMSDADLNALKEMFDKPSRWEEENV
ncbi:MAG: hypothetical protein IIW86_06885 [Clostridia bacterium]|nr:hypothetical protein [Clostridia bacterium]